MNLSIKIFILFLFTSLAHSSQSQNTIYVSPEGNGTGKGTLKNPYTSIQKAVEAATRLSKGMDEDIVVYLRGGIYNLSSPLKLDEKHSGKNGFNIIYKAYKDEKPVISGGVAVKGWEKVPGAADELYMAKLDRDTKLRSLFVNGQRKRMAGTDEPVNGLGDWGRFRIEGNEPWAYGSGTGIEGIKFSSADVGLYQNPEDIELVQFNVWTEKILCAREMVKAGDTTIIKLQQPYGAIATSMAWAGKINYDKAFVIRNAYELLDSPGEFYFDRSTQTLYYYSEGEDMSTAEVIAPSSPGLLHIAGKSTSERVENIVFDGITFSHDDWQLMEVAGSHAFAGIQSLGLAVKFIPDGNWHPTRYNSTNVPRGTIQVENASNIQLVNNRFEKLGSAIAVNLVNDVVQTDVTGNYFHDMLGNAVNVGHPQHYEIGDGDIFPAGVEGVCKEVQVANNYLRNVCLDFRQVEGITSFFVEKIRIEYNDISGTPYGAITCGWWWGNAEIPPSKVARENSISYNKAGNSHQVLDDGGIIYVLGEQPDSQIRGNYVFNGPRSIYPDDGSAYWVITKNVVGNHGYKLWLHLWSPRCHDNVAFHNYVKNNLYMDNGTNNIVSGTYSFRTEEFSEDAQKIIQNAGIQEQYKHIVPEEEPPVINIHPAGFKETDRFH